MLCPQCQVLLTANKQLAVDVNNCPKCQGIWLQQSVLETLITQSNLAEISNIERIPDQSKPKISNARRKRPHFLSGAFDISDDW